MLSDADWIQSDSKQAKQLSIKSDHHTWKRLQGLLRSSCRTGNKTEDWLPSWIWWRSGYTDSFVSRVGGWGFSATVCGRIRCQQREAYQTVWEWRSMLSPQLLDDRLLHLWLGTLGQECLWPQNLESSLELEALKHNLNSIGYPVGFTKHHS